MRSRRELFSLIVAVLAAAAPLRASADEGCSTLRRDNIVRCAVGSSAAVRVERENVAAAEGRKIAASPWFPSPPVLAASVARRAGTEGRSGTVNYYGTLGQEIEIAGQRPLRRKAAEADVAARGADVLTATRRAAASALVSYFEGIAARETLAIAQRVEASSRQIARVTAARAASGVAAPLDAEVAEAVSLRFVQSRIAAEREQQASGVELAVLLGRDPMHGVPEIEGPLEPLAGAEALAAKADPKLVLQRPEIRARAFDQRAQEARAEAYRRARVPNLTLQLFAQNDGYDEKVFGAGLLVPIPLPHPVGRMYIGEIAEAEALARRNARGGELSVRELSGELAIAAIAYRTRRAEAELYPRERVARAEGILSDIAKEIDGGRLPVRDALLAQQQLIDVVRGGVETRRALCLASVDLTLAAGVPLESIR